MAGGERDRFLGEAGSAEPGTVVYESVAEVAGRRWRRLVIKTHVIQPGEDVAAVAARYAGPLVRRGDVVFVGQKATSIAERRLIAEDAIRPRRLATFLCRFVHASPYGFGLKKPQTMEVALRVAGTPRILLAAGAGAAGRLFGRRGDFFRLAGRAVASIDGATDWALPPFNRYIVMAPLAPNRTARRIAERLGRGVRAAIVDLNDLGGEVLGASPGVDRRWLARVLRDNPIGQGPFQTPLGIIRAVPAASGEPGMSVVDRPGAGARTGTRRH